MLHAIVLSLYPLHWFFTFLYYTDVASVTAVLAMYLASLEKNYWLSALIVDSTHSIIVFLIDYEEKKGYGDEEEEAGGAASVRGGDHRKR
ncbi:hypothetical protein RYX36_008691 [Vicia faba]